MNSHGYVRAEAVPSAMRLPRETSGGWIPKPRYERPVSLRIVAQTFSVASIIRIEATFGSKCLNTILCAGTPMY